MFSTLDDVAAIVASRPTGDSMIPLPVPTDAARIVPARNVGDGDVILAAVDKRPEGYTVDWFCEAYTAHPQPFNPTCSCGVCCLADPADGEHVVLTDESHDGPWLACDPWPVDRLVLVVPVFRPLPVGQWVKFHDGKKERRGKIRGVVEPGYGRPIREGSECYPGGYIVGGYRITPAWGQQITPIH